MISCEKAAHLMDKKDFENLSGKEKRALWWHNLYCKLCRKYHRFSKSLTGAFKDVKKKTPTLSDADKNKLKDNLSSK